MTTLSHYYLQADPASGEWIDAPTYVDQVDFGAWCEMEDTEGRHYDTYEYYGEERGELLYPDGQTRAITVEWVSSGESAE